jgi:hypothetical protein
LSASAARLLPRGRPGTAWLLALGLLAFEVGAVLVLSEDSAVEHFATEWIHTATVFVAAFLCWWRAASEPAGRAAWLAFGAATACFGVGEGIAAGYGDDSPPIPSVADVFWLLWYPFAGVGIAYLVRHHVARFELHRWVDGLAIVLLVAIPGVGLVLEPVLEESGEGGVAELLGFLYPLADLMLIGAVLGVLPLHGWRPGRIWPILGLGLLLIAGADVAYYIENAEAEYRPGVVDPFWSTGVLLVALAAWQAPDRPEREPEIVGWKAVALPVAVQAVAVGIQIYAYSHELPESERILTVAVLLLAMVQIIASRPRVRGPTGDG